MYKYNRRETHLYRRGFTLVETIACALILSVVILGVLGAASTIKNSQASARNRLYLGVHQLNVMEELRQKAFTERLLAFYDESAFSTSDITTTVRIEESALENFIVYRVEMESKMKDSKDFIYNVFTLTDIGQPEEEVSLE